jgi:hypothetical protein
VFAAATVEGLVVPLKQMGSTMALNANAEAQPSCQGRLRLLLITEFIWWCVGGDCLKL